MGNCFFGSTADPDAAAIKVITSNGGVMEFSSPVTVNSIADEFPGHGIFRSHDLFWKPLSQYDELVAGHSYYLLPLNNNNSNDDVLSCDNNVVVRQGHIRSNSVPMTMFPAPYRMTMRSSMMEPFSSSRRFWKVKLVINPERLLEILAQEARTKELIESVRIVAKCGGGGSSGVSSAASGIVSDQWSLSSTNWSISSNTCDALAAGI